MVTMGGGSIGFQAGVQSADIVLVFATPRSLEGILKGQKVTLGADASIALGPVGRQANAGTDARLGAEIYSYARSRGLFAGVSLGGADLSVDHNADAVLYGRAGVSPSDVFQARGLAFHQEVQQLIDDLNARAKPVVVPVPNFPPQQPSAHRHHHRRAPGAVGATNEQHALPVVDAENEPALHHARKDGDSLGRIEHGGRNRFDGHAAELVERLPRGDDGLQFLLAGDGLKLRHRGGREEENNRPADDRGDRDAVSTHGEFLFAGTGMTQGA